MRVVLVAMVLIAAMGIGCGKVKEAVGAKSSVTAEAIPDTWTHREFVDHLDSKGVKVRAIPTGIGAFHGPAQFLILNESDISDDKQADKALNDKTEGVVYCILLPSAQAAKDRASTGPRRAIGRFVLSGNANDLEKIQSSFR